jgi:hypothetical protein
VSLVTAVDPFVVRVNDVEVEVDHRTFTLGERRASRAALLAMSGDDDLAPDEMDALGALVWVVLRRSQPDLTLGDVVDSLTIGDLVDARTLDPAALTDKDDDPEA